MACVIVHLTPLRRFVLGPHVVLGGLVDRVRPLPQILAEFGGDLAEIGWGQAVSPPPERIAPTVAARPIRSFTRSRVSLTVSPKAGVWLFPGGVAGFIGSRAALCGEATNGSKTDSGGISGSRPGPEGY